MKRDSTQSRCCHLEEISSSHTGSKQHSQVCTNNQLILALLTDYGMLDAEICYQFCASLKFKRCDQRFKGRLILVFRHAEK